MKKKLMVTVMMVMAVAALNGCGKEPNTSNATNSVETKVEQAAASNEKEEAVVEEVTKEEVKEEKTLKQYFDDNNLNSMFDAEIDNAKKTAQGAYTDIEWEIDGNIMSYIYTSATEMQLDDAQSDYMSQSFQTTANQILPGMINESKIDDIGIRYIYKNPDGTVIYDETFYLDK